ncbi:MAG: rubrerythrin [Nitrospirae bacterium]|nr:rubrerythrin [Nitrospirota bacterium]
MNGSGASESVTLIDIVREAIQKEIDSYNYYYNAASVAVKPAAKRMFLKLAAMEEGHAAELGKHLSDLEAQLHIDKAISSSF